MLMTGVAMLVYVLLHLAHFTLGKLDKKAFELEEVLVRGGEEVVRHDVHGMLIASFQNELFVGFYVLAMIVLGFHLSHGLKSLFQSLGLRHRGYTPLIERVAPILAWVLALGYLSIPVLVRAGVIT